MALSDLFRGMKAGTDMYFETENEAQDLAAKRLTLLGLEQKFADEQYLKPAELADRLSRHRHSAVKNTADADSILKLRPLEDTYNEAVHRYNTGEVGIKQAIQNLSRGTQVGTGVAQADNAFKDATILAPAQREQNTSAAKWGTTQNKIGHAIDKGSFGTQVAAGVIDEKTKGINAGSNYLRADNNAQYAQRVHRFIQDNPRFVQNMVASDLHQEAAAGRLALHNTLTQEQLVMKNREAEGLLVEMERNPQQAEAILQGALNSDDVVMQGAGLDIITGLRTQYEQQQAAALKAAGAQGVVNQEKQQRSYLAGRILLDPVGEFMRTTGVTPVLLDDGNYMVGEEVFSRAQLGELAASRLQLLGEYYDHAKNQNSLNKDSFYDSNNVRVGSVNEARRQALDAALSGSGLQRGVDGGVYKVNQAGEAVQASVDDIELAKRNYLLSIPEEYRPYITGLLTDIAASTAPSEVSGNKYLDQAAAWDAVFAVGAD